MLAFLRILYWRFRDFVHRDRSLGFGGDKGDAHHMSMAWIHEKKRDASW